MEIRRITDYNEQEYESLLHLLPQLSPEADLPSKSYFKSFVESEGIHFFLAQSESKDIIGTFTLATYYIPTGLKVWIEDVVIDQSQRGNGLGKELIKFAIDYSRSLKAKEVRLTSRPTRIEANKLYLKMGFTPYETNVYKYIL